MSTHQSTSLDDLPTMGSSEDAPVQPSVETDDDSHALVNKIMERLNKNGDASSADDIPSSQKVSSSTVATPPTVDADPDVRSRKKADAADHGAKSTGTKTAPKPSMYRGAGIGNVAHVVPQMSMVHQILEGVKSVVLFTLLYTILSNELVQGAIKRLPYISDGANVNILGTVVLGIIGGSVLTAANMFT